MSPQWMAECTLSSLRRVNLRIHGSSLVVVGEMRFLEIYTLIGRRENNDISGVNFYVKKALIMSRRYKNWKILYNYV